MPRRRQAIALVVSSERNYESRCREAFRAKDLFPVVVDSLHDAVTFLRQSRADVVLLVTAPTLAETAPSALQRLAHQVPVVRVPSGSDPEAHATTLDTVLERG